MPKQIVTVSIDEDTIKEIDSFAENLGLSRSAAINMMLTGCVGGKTGISDTFGQMLKAATEVKKQKRTSKEKMQLQA